MASVPRRLPDGSGTRPTQAYVAYDADQAVDSSPTTYIERRTGIIPYVEDGRVSTLRTLRFETLSQDFGGRAPRFSKWPILA